MMEERKEMKAGSERRKAERYAKGRKTKYINEGRKNDRKERKERTTKERMKGGGNQGRKEGRKGAIQTKEVD
jgi:hypothetical protein